MALLLREDDVRALLPMSRALELITQTFRLQGSGDAVNQPRRRVPYPGGMLNYMAGAVPSARAAGLKTYAITRQGATFVVLLFDTETGHLLAMIEGDWLGRIRTGAASGVATATLARPEASILGVIGAGRQAETQIEAISQTRPLTDIKIYSRTPESRQALAERLGERIEARVTAVRTAREAVEDSDIVTTITNAGQPVFEGSWLRAGCHVNAAGSNRPKNPEIDEVTISRASVIAVDSLEQSGIESGDLIQAVESGHVKWENVRELGAIIASKAPGRQHPDDITLFESQGIAIEDVMAARWIYDAAVREGRGEQVAFGGAPA